MARRAGRSAGRRPRRGRGHAALCRAGRAEQGEQRIPDGLFEHLIREWEAFRAKLSAAHDAAPFDSITIVDREAADRLRRVQLSPST